MTPFDLIFLASVLFVFICLIAIVVSATCSRRASLRRWATILLAYVALYAVALISTSLELPRRIYFPGERRCWDDWCATVFRSTPASASASPPCASAPGAQIWLVEITISSVAKRVSQSAPDARAEVEDAQGARYSPCSAPLAEGAAPAHALSDRLNPGDAFPVLLPFQLPANRRPAGIVMHHGSFPGIVIIADDSAFLHRPALHQLTASSQN